MEICQNCLRAQTSHTWGGYTADCEGCGARGIALSPKFIREHWYEMTLAKGGREALDAMKKRISEEWARIQRLKAKSAP